MKKNKKHLFIVFFLIICVTLSGCNSNVDEKDSNTSQIIENAKVSYLGPEGTYTEEAAQYFFGEKVIYIPKATVSNAVDDVISGKSDYAVIPQENTLGGAVIAYVDELIAQKNVYVIGEVILPISQTLMGIPGTLIEEIQLICSHTQGITQTKEWREKYLPNVKTQEMSSTAAAASYVAEKNDKTIAAIAAPGAAKLYGLTVLAENVQITNTNKTKFYVLSKTKLEGNYKNATFIVTCEASKIDDIIVEIHNSGLELMTIHDRPEGGFLGSYHYVLEVKCDNNITSKCMKIIEKYPEVRFLGCYDIMEKQN